MDEEKKQLLQTNLELIDTGQKVLREICQAQERVRERALGHTYQLVTAIGIVAGFGFTAVSSVQSIEKFLSGELLLFSAMALGMWFAKAGFIDEIEFYNKWRESVSSILDDRMKVDNQDSTDVMKQKLEAAKKRELTIFEKDIKLPHFRWLGVILVLFIFGGGLLLLSFLTL